MEIRNFRRDHIWLTYTYISFNFMNKQEWIPVGCVPPAHWSYPVVSAVAHTPPLPHMPPTTPTHHHTYPPPTMHAPRHACPLPHMPPAMHTPIMHTPCHACPLPCKPPCHACPLPHMPPCHACPPCGPTDTCKKSIIDTEIKNFRRDHIWLCLSRSDFTQFYE